MTTDTAAEPTIDATAALTTALLGQGWAYTNPVRTERQWRSRIHELASPDGRLSLDASAFPDGHMIARLSAEAVRTGPGRAPGWMADLHEVPLPVALAAVTAAADLDRPPHPAVVAVTAALAGVGWAQHTDVTERGRLLERQWESPDGQRFVRWCPADRDDEGGWTVERHRPDGEAAETHISQHTPAAVITALALTDDTASHPDRTAPSTAPAPDGS
jgi:hypothetical protein